MVIVQCVENGFALPPEAHKLGVLEHPQLVADGRLAQLHGVRDILLFSAVGNFLTSAFSAQITRRTPPRVMSE